MPKKKAAVVTDGQFRRSLRALDNIGRGYTLAAVIGSIVGVGAVIAGLLRAVSELPLSWLFITASGGAPSRRSVASICQALSLERDVGDDF